MVVSPRPQNAENVLVETILDCELGQWNSSAVRNSFLPHEASTILSISISQNLPEDAWVWAWTKKGIFTVKSAYHVAHGWLSERRSLGTGGEESNRQKKKKFWTSIWSLKCPGKVRHFLWKVCKNILPTNLSLWLRKVSKDKRCGLCGLAESSGHALWECGMAEAVWKEAKFSVKGGCLPFRDFIDVVWKVWENQKEGELERLVCLAWCIWKNRNAVKFGGKGKEARSIVSEANALVEEFGLLPEVLIHSASPRTGTWTPPRDDWYKINVDGAVFKESSSCGIRIVIRNERGELMGAMSKKLEFPLGALEVEAKAFEEGLSLDGDLGLRQVVLEGDSKAITDALRGCCSPPLSIKMITDGIMGQKQNALAWEVSWVRRNCNMAAHLLARNAQFVSESIVWVEDIPPCIEFQVSKDVADLDFVQLNE